MATPRHHTHIMFYINDLCVIKSTMETVLTHDIVPIFHFDNLLLYWVYVFQNHNRNRRAIDDNKFEKIYGDRSGSDAFTGR